MSVPTTKLKIALIVIVLLAVIVAGVKIYQSINARSESNQVKSACQRAALYHQQNTGPLVELTADDAICMQGHTQR